MASTKSKKPVTKSKKPVTVYAGSTVIDPTALNPDATPVIDPDSLQQLKNAYGNDAFWLTDPKIGPVLLATLTAGRDSKGHSVRLVPNTTEFQQFIATHGVNDQGQVIVTNDPKFNWWVAHGSDVALSLQERSADPATYNQGVAGTLADVQMYAREQGYNLDPSIESALAEQLYQTKQSVKSALTRQKIDSLAPYNAHATQGRAAAEQSTFNQIMSEYGIPIPKNPADLAAYQANMKNLVKQSLAPGGNASGGDEGFLSYAKTQAKAMYPWMSSAIDAGVTPKQYLQPYITTIANTLEVPADSINLQDPKWMSLFTVNDAAHPGLKVASNYNDVMKTIKNDPQYGYDYTSGARTQGADFATQAKQILGF